MGSGKEKCGFERGGKNQKMKRWDRSGIELWGKGGKL